MHIAQFSRIKSKFYSFCPGLNHIVSSGFDWLNSEWHGRAGEGIDLTTFPNGEEAAEELWEKINFSLDKVVVSLFGYTGNDLTESYSTGEEVTSAPKQCYKIFVLRIFCLDHWRLP